VILLARTLKNNTHKITKDHGEQFPIGWRGAETWGFRESPGYVEKELNPITENTPCWKP
jgi:hypothetical protein